MWGRKRGNKFNNHKVEIDGHKFDSQAEATHYRVLLADKRDDKILGFELQPEFVLQPAFKGQDGTMIRAIKYRADFLVFHDGYTEIIDVKGFRTKEWAIKWKMLQYQNQSKGYKFTIV